MAALLGHPAFRHRDRLDGAEVAESAHAIAADLALTAEELDHGGVVVGEVLGREDSVEARKHHFACAIEPQAKHALTRLAGAVVSTWSPTSRGPKARGKIGDRGRGQELAWRGRCLQRHNESL